MTTVMQLIHHLSRYPAESVVVVNSPGDGAAEFVELDLPVSKVYKTVIVPVGPKKELLYLPFGNIDIKNHPEGQEKPVVVLIGKQIEY